MTNTQNQPDDTSSEAAVPRKSGVLLAVVLLTVVLEVITLLLRFGLEWESTRDTAATIGWLTGGLRIHHSYCGALLVLVGFGLSQHSALAAKVLYIVGWSLLLSDVIHHFLILWPVTGSPQFDLVYPT